MTPEADATEEWQVAVVGLGYWGPKLLRNLVRLLGPGRVIGVETSSHRRVQVGLEFPAVRMVASLESVLEEDRVKGVVIATPTGSHAELARRTLLSGRGVLVEKPLCSSLADAIELGALAERKGLTLMVGHTFLFSPRVQAIADYLATGEMGRIYYVMSSRLNLGLHRSDVNVIWDLAAHDFSIVCHLLGEYPGSIHAVARGVVRPSTPDVAFIEMMFDSGAIASVNVSWLAPRKVRSTVLVGDRSMIMYDDTEGDEPIKICDKGVVIPESSSFGENQLTYRYGPTTAPYVPASEPLSRELQHFLDCLRKPEEPCLSDARSGVEVVRMLDAADRSWRDGGRPVVVSGDPDRAR